MIRSSATLWISAATVWEMSIKTALNRLKLAKPVEEIIALLLGHGFRPLPITIQHALTVRNLPPLHTDPFDRVLVAQAQFEGLTIVTLYPVIQQYNVLTIDASK